MARVLLALLALGAAYVLWVVLAAGERTQAALALADHYQLNGLTPDDLPEEWLTHLLLVEDPAFFDHNGVDLSSPGAGLTTITQALVKIHYFDDFQPGFAKLKQTILALVADRKISKQQQLVLLLNTARMGNLDDQAIQGFAQASQAYLGKPVTSLSHREFLSLVAMLVGPTQFHILGQPDANAGRAARIEALIAGRCEPQGLTDVYYQACAPSSFQ